ncbi:hypothetical protein HYR99_14610 [Candidatus Poribacteria bacterium]|nr:hypothetical protein [Candidatus Poribacteria bacterium]
MIIIYLLIATLSVFIGAAIAFISRGNANLFSAIFGFTAGTVLGILLLLILHLYGEFGIFPLFVMGGGFLLIFLIERLTHRFPKLALKDHHWVADLTLIGLLLHEVSDGFNLVIAATTQDKQIGVAILAHRLPVAIALTLAFRKNNSTRGTLGRLSLLAIAPLIGALIGKQVLSVFGEFTEYLTAFAAGTLLHILFHDFRGDLAPNREGKYAGVIAFAIGLVAVFLITHNSNFWHAH